MELKKSWTVILSAIDRSNGQCEASLYVTAITQLMRFSLLDLRLYLTEMHSIMKFAVQVTALYCDFKSYHSILYDLQRNYDNIAQSCNLQIITARDNDIVLVHKDVLMLRSPVFKVLFDRLHYLCYDI